MPGGMHKLDCPHSGKGATIRDPFPPVPAILGSLRGPGACPPAVPDTSPDPIVARAVALAATPAELERETLEALRKAPPAAYLRFLREADPALWRERVLAIVGTENGNLSRAARRAGLTYRGLLKAITADPKLQQEVSARWPERHERGMFR